ncbi:DUF930 domain-containing protein [Methylosinus trichosporium OB3b]|uniref:DUF930 domain-containing protein n=1 Tax=Methylosinus trichosporium (strain ATCC 35070 / NCIMB 11131 / UNIQEM 75 / OB3b) TaxID=595536 RepID=A0A2D2D271_METT3|nr:DUF930 domain-containing protein [Methylosinus trichosporium OB3b]
MKSRFCLKSGSYRIYGAAWIIALSLLAPSLVPRSFADDARTRASLQRLDLQMRLEQVCDLEAMERIGHETSLYRPDRAKSDVISHPKHLGDILSASGAAFRSGGRWYALSFICKASADHLKVLTFDYRIGDVIPEAKWTDYGLWR